MCKYDASVKEECYWKILMSECDEMRLVFTEEYITLQMWVFFICYRLVRAFFTYEESFLLQLSDSNWYNFLL